MTANDFLKKYGINTTFEELYAIQRKTNRNDNFTFKDGAISFDKKNYIDGLKYMLSAYMSKHTSPKNMDLQLANIFEDFGFLQFIRDYESAMQDEFRKSGSTRSRKPYEGVRNIAVNTVKEQMIFFNDTLKNIWVKSIKNGAHLDAFREASIGALEAEAENIPTAKMNFINQSENISVEDHHRMVKESGDVNITNEQTSAIKMTFAVYMTMKEVIDRRTWGWRLNPFNWSRLREENKLMRDVKAKLVERYGKATLKIKERDELRQLGDFAKNRVLHTDQLAAMEDFLEKLEEGKVELNPTEREKNELENLANELDKDEFETEIQSEEIDFTQMEEDFKKLTSESEDEPVIDYFDAQDPNLYNPSTESADDIFLAEDSVEEAKEITPAYKELAEASNPDNIILEGILEAEMKEEQDRAREIELEKEREKERQKQLEREREIERQKQLEREREREKERERERQKEREKAQQNPEMNKEANQALDKLSNLEKPQNLSKALGMIRSKATSAIVYDAFANILAKTGNPNLNQTVYREMLMDIRPFWNEQAKMSEHVTNMFNRAYKALPEMNTADRLIAAQKMTDIALNLFTPVGSEKAYEKYRNNYYIQNTKNEDIQYFTKYSGNVDELMTNVKVELGIIKEVKKDAADKENVQFKKGEFEEKVEEKSLKVEKDNSLVMQNVIDK